MSISENLEGSYLDALAGQRSVEHRKILRRMKFRDYLAGNVIEPSVQDSTLSVPDGLGCGLYAKLYATRRCSGGDGRQ